MKPRCYRQALQNGYLLFEALVSLLIFSVGVLGILGMMAVAVKSNSSAKYRADASLLANELIGQMWADNRDPATLLSNYQGGGGTDGPKYTAWLADIINEGRLPGVTANVNAPTVVVTTINGVSPPTTSKSQVVITLFWQMPDDATPPDTSLCFPHPHCYVAVTEIK